MVYSENENDLVSVVIPVYNCERFVAEAIESVLCQTYRPLEIIVVDDGSNDSSLKIIEKYNNHVEIVSQQNSGVSVARNKGIHQAKGEYIAFLDGDDVWLPNKIEKQIEVLKRYDEVILVSSLGDCINENGNQSNFEPKYQMKNFNEPADLSHELLMNGNPVWTSSVVVRKEVLMNTDLFDAQQRRSQDYDMWIRLSEKGLFYIFQEKLGKYRVLKTSQTFRDIRKEYEAQIDVIKKNSWRYKPGELRKRLAKLYYEWSFSAFCYDTFKAGIISAGRSFKYQPLNIRLYLLVLLYLFKKPLKAILLKNNDLYGNKTHHS
jgi:glycosyltransferase involved in cell wall biosynthesis